MSITIDEPTALHCLRLINGANVASWKPEDIISHGKAKEVLTNKLVDLHKENPPKAKVKGKKADKDS